LVRGKGRNPIWQIITVKEGKKGKAPSFLLSVTGKKKKGRSKQLPGDNRTEGREGTFTFGRQREKILGGGKFQPSCGQECCRYERTFDRCRAEVGKAKVDYRVARL